MEQLLAGRPDLTLEPKVASAYERAFGSLLLGAEKFRPRISPKERSVTKQLASPFTLGGLLVLLTQPRPHHPWDNGIDHVIADCATLDALNEGIQIGSEGKLCLKNGVSVLDLRPCLPQTFHHNLDEENWRELYDLVFSAIEEKRPDVILCMGAV